MKKIKIITDSTSDLTSNIIEKYDIEVLPLLINFGDESYKDKIDIDLSTLLAKMQHSNQFPGTSQVNPQRFMKCYRQYLDKGYEIISIHISSKLSGTYHSACMAKEMLETDDIVVIDSLNATGGLGLLVLKAAILKEDGLGISQIQDKILELIPHVKSSLAFNSLDNVVKGGRLSKTAGIIGNILGIKPILSLENGEVVVKDKIRGSKKTIRYILDYIDKKGVKEGEISNLVHIENKDILDSLREALQKSHREFIECEVGCVIGVYAGPNACGVFFIEDY